MVSYFSKGIVKAKTLSGPGIELGSLFSFLTTMTTISPQASIHFIILQEVFIFMGRGARLKTFETYWTAQLAGRGL